MIARARNILKKITGRIGAIRPPVTVKKSPSIYKTEQKYVRLWKTQIVICIGFCGILGIVLFGEQSIPSRLADLRQLAHEICFFVTAVVCVHLIYDFSAKQQDRILLLHDIEETVAKTVDKFLPSKESGLAGVISKIDFAKLFKDLSSEDDELLWLDTYAPARTEVALEICKAVIRGAKIKILAIDPNCQNAVYRGNEIQQLGYNQSSFNHDLRSFIDSLVELRNFLHPKTPASGTPAVVNPPSIVNHSIGDLYVPSPVRGRLEIKLYNTLPCIPMYVHRRGKPTTAFTSYFLSVPSDYLTHLSWTAATDGMIHKFAKYFDDKWELARNPDDVPVDVAASEV